MDEHRLVYLVDGDDVVILQARHHYSCTSDNSTRSAVRCAIYVP
ncbi:MAG: type II toxin-antitoxin system YoeB family toxin [Actinomycetota bacterium]|nr:type II toxin-antitoxin system YoeB family toxin [Actinomycetota bacterium]